MRLTVNQVLVICLILVLIAFLVILATMAKHAIGLIERSKVLVKSGNEMVDEAKSRLNTITDRMLDTINRVADDTAPAVKAFAGTGMGFFIINVVNTLFKGVTGRIGIVNSMAAKAERKKAQKEIKRSQETIKALNRQAQLERKAYKNAARQQKKLAAKAAKSKKKGFFASLKEMIFG